MNPTVTQTAPDERTQLGQELNRLFHRRGDLETVLEDLNAELAETKQAIQSVRRRMSQLPAPQPQPAPRLVMPQGDEQNALLASLPAKK